MPQVAPIVLTDNAAVDHTFDPQNVEKGVAYYAAHSVDGTPEKDGRLSAGLRTQPNSARRGSVKIQLPVIRSVDGVDVVVDTNILEINARMSSKSTDVERSQLTSLGAASLNDTFIQALLNDLSGPY